MPEIVSLSHDYTADAARVFAAATDWGAMRASMNGLMVYHGLPQTGPFQGQRIVAQYQLFGFMPRQTWTMEIVHYAPAEFRIASHEFGGPVRRWDHDMRVEPIAGGARLIETIAIDAGALTAPHAAFARWMYQRRHRVRQNALAAL